MASRVWYLVSWHIAGSFLLAFAPPVFAVETTGQGKIFTSTIRPLLARYCHECHAQDVTEADIDLAAFATLADVRKDVNIWLKIRHMLDSGQMPPKDADQPADADRVRLQKWVHDFLKREAQARAGDPGPVLLRRLSNAEYTYTIRDLTGVDSLDPAREFPIDGAAGEGFTNVGSGQGMSPAVVQKYLDAAKQVAGHAVLLPDGVGFSPHESRRDQTDQLLADIQAFYRRFTNDGGGASVDLQGIRFDTNQGGLLPLEKYLAATLAERDALQSGTKTVETLARERSLSPRYLATLWTIFNGQPDAFRSGLIDAVRQKWRNSNSADAAKLAAEIAAAQRALWKFNSVGHVGRDGGAKAWMEAVSPITTRQDLRLKLPDAPSGSEVVFYLTASDFGDGNDQDFVVWHRPRIEFKSRSPILLRDIRTLTQRADGTIASQAAQTEQYLDAVVVARTQSKPVGEVAREKGLDPQVAEKWAAAARFGEASGPEITGHFTAKLARGGGNDAINGWGSPQTPSLVTNRSDKPISLGTPIIPARAVTLHPSPTLESIVAWRSPIAGRIQLSGRVADADNKCGNGAAWRIELHGASGRNVLSRGQIDNGREQRFQLDAAQQINRGDVVSLVVNARDSSHICDTTHVELTIVEADGQRRTWDLAADVVDRVLEGNPLADSYGNKDVWHFCAVKTGGAAAANISQPLAPPGSALARWREAVVQSKPAAEIERLATAVQSVLAAEDVAKLAAPDQLLRQRLLAGLESARFGKHPSGSPVDEADLCLQAPLVIEVRLPAALVAGGEFVTSGIIHPQSGKEGSVQLQLLAEKPAALSASLEAPVLVSVGDDARRRMEESLDEFRNLFPPALCYARIVPVDEVVTLTLFHREDHHLKRLMLNDAQSAEMDRLWDELLYVSQEPLKLVVVYEQLVEFATQDRPDLVKAFASLNKPINDRADAFRARLVETEPAHVQAMLEFAARAWRRPVAEGEQQQLRELYRSLRESELPHEEAIRLLLARVLTSPAFLYKLEQPAPGKNAAPATDLELATRLSYFLWSSLPDDELRQVAESGQLSDNAALMEQTQRLLKDPRTRRLAVQFACQWLHVREFDQNDDKNEQLYPEFASLRGEMYEETVRFFEDLFRNDGSILDMLDADHTFLNEKLARHYGIDGLNGSGTDWRRVENVRSRGRGGVLGMATVLASQSGASRTSPILRGNWVYETLLGERLPRPPANVPQLPETVPDGLTARQLIERHSKDAACAKCHARIDPYGFALEQYDAIGRLRPKQVDTKTKLPGGKEIEGIDGLRDYLAKDRLDDFVRQFCRKLMGFALGRELQLSDEPLLNEMQTKLAANDFRFGAAVEIIVTSRQFREIRGSETALDE